MNITIRISILVFILSINTYSNSEAQVFSSDQNPPSLKWEQINTENFQIIYPSGFSSEAQRTASVLERILKEELHSIRTTPKKISIILQNQGTQSNGFVQLGPRRSEFYTTPSQSFDFQNWINSLAVHELRHVVQFDKLTGNLNRPFFEKLALAIFGITLPPWFYEGDAVSTETALTHAGRGRIPEWSVILRSNTLSGRNFSYSKNYLGSLKDFTPGYYQLGFFMNTKLRRDYGTGITDSILSRISRTPLQPYSFSNAVKKFTGMNTRKLHDSTISELNDLWQKQLVQTPHQHYPAINKRKDKTPENYLLPAARLNGKTLSLKNSKASTPAVVEIDSSGRERNLISIGSQEVPWFSYAAEKIVWDEFRYDLRFHQRSFNVINILDLKSGKGPRQLTHRTRLFAPALSPDGERIIAVDVSYSNEISLVEINAETGRTIRRYPAPANHMLQMPSFHPSGDKVITVGVGTTGKTLYELDRHTGTFTRLLPFQLQEILRPVYGENEIFFKAHFNGIDNIYALNIRNQQIQQVSKAKLGAYNPFYDTISHRLIFNTYSENGYDIAALNANFIKLVNISGLPDTSIDYAAPLYHQEGSRNVMDSLPSKTFEARPYKDIHNLFYFHSIVPIAEDNQFFDDYNIGLELQSDNKLNTLSFYTGYQFNNALRKSEYRAGFFYKRYFPILSFHYINRPRLIYRRSASGGSTVLSAATWRENEWKGEITLPLTFNRFNYTYSTGFKTGSSFTTRYHVEGGMPSLIRQLDFPMHYQFYANRNSRRSSRDLAPRWGQNVTLTYRHFPFEDQVEGDIFTLRSWFYFPGLLRNHSFQVSFNYQSNSGNYQNTVDIPRVSGYSFLKPLANTENTFFLDYQLPLFYPDWEIGPLAYIKRFRAGLFADFENIGKANSLSPRSFGAEIRANMNLLRFYLPNFDIGGKVVFLNEKSSQNPIFEAMATYSF